MEFPISISSQTINIYTEGPVMGPGFFLAYFQGCLHASECPYESYEFM